MLKFLPLALAFGIQVAQLPQAPPKLFSADADAKEKIAATIGMAATDDIRALIVWGANDDPLSLSFDAARKSPEIARSTFFSDEYKIVFVDVGHLDKNVNLAKSYGANLAAGSLPAMTVLDDHGRPVAQARAEDLSSAERRNIDAAKVAAFLKTNQAAAPDAVAPFEAAVKEAKASGKYVFLWFSAPWCGWCHRLGAWMTLEEVSPILDKEFISLKLDYDRGIGARDVERRYTQTEQGLPWFAFIDGDGKAITTSSAKPDGSGNVGCPWEPEEIAWFKTMLKTAPRHLTGAEIDGLIASLQEFRRKTEAK